MFYRAGHEKDADLGPLISPQAKQRVCDLVQSGVKDGCELLLDGRDIKVKGYEKGNFVGPTVLHKVQVSQGQTDHHALGADRSRSKYDFMVHSQMRLELWL